MTLAVKLAGGKLNDGQRLGEGYGYRGGCNHPEDDNFFSFFIFLLVSSDSLGQDFRPLFFFLPSLYEL